MLLVKLRSRIVVGLLIIVGAGFFYLTNWIINDLRPHYLKSMEESLVDISTLLSSLVAQEMITDTNVTDNLRAAFKEASKRVIRAQIYDMHKKKMVMRVYITDALGKVVFDSDDGRAEGKDYSRWNDVHLTLKGKYGARSSRETATDPTSSWLYVASPIMVHGNINGVLTVGKPVKSINLFVVHAKNKIIIAGIIAGLAVIILGIFLSTWVTWPIRKLTDYARAIRDGKHAQLPQLGTFNKQGHSEIGIMGAAFDEMREALEGKKYIENYVQTLTHEIKSPLSAIRGAAELMDEEMPPEKRRQFLGNILTESNRIQSFIDRLLQLASLENRKGLKDIEPVDCKELIQDIAGNMHPIFENKKIELEQSFEGNTTVMGERFLIRQALVNLLQNSLDFSPAESTISIRVHNGSDMVSIVVEDNGPGIPDFAQDKIFNRFYSLNRPDNKKKSTGLGLTFVKEVAVLHDGTIKLENHPDGGTRAELKLPAEAEPQ